MATDTRVPKTEVTGIYGALIKYMTRKRLGEVPEAVGVVWNQPAVLKDMSAFSRKAEKWDKVDRNLKTFAHMAVASFVGCSWCLDFAYFTAHNEGLVEAKAREVPRWRESDLFTPLERDVMEYAEAMSETPPTVTDELSARLLEQLGAAGVVELTAFVGFSNLTTRNNVAMGIKSQGFSSVCELPLAQPTARAGA